VNRPIKSEIYKTPDCMENFPYIDLNSLINKLMDLDGFVRMRAPEVLCCLGTPAIPALIKTLPDANSKLRWEVIKVLECIQDPTSISILVEQLKDDNAGIRRAASNALVGMQREALPAILAHSCVISIASGYVRVSTTFCMCLRMMAN
jgi:HEAT repeat protein